MAKVIIWETRQEFITGVISKIVEESFLKCTELYNSLKGDSKLPIEQFMLTEKHISYVINWYTGKGVYAIKLVDDNDQLKNFNVEE